MSLGWSLGMPRSITDPLPALWDAPGERFTTARPKA